MSDLRASIPDILLSYAGQCERGEDGMPTRHAQAVMDYIAEAAEDDTILAELQEWVGADEPTGEFPQLKSWDESKHPRAEDGRFGEKPGTPDSKPDDAKKDDAKQDEPKGEESKPARASAKDVVQKIRESAKAFRAQRDDYVDLKIACAKMRQNRTATDGERIALATKTKAARKEYEENAEKLRGEVAEALKSDTPWKVEPKFKGVTAKHEAKATAALQWLSGITSWAGPSSIGIEQSEDGRAYANDSTGVVYLADDDAAMGHDTTTVHEVAHLITANKPGVLEKTRAFLEARCKDQPTIDMGEIHPAYEGEKGQMGRNFDIIFDHDAVRPYYLGKQYEAKGDMKANNEVLSMGLDLMYSDPAHFFSVDREFAELVIECLR